MPIPVQQHVGIPQEKAKPTAHASERASVRVRRTAPPAVSTSPAVAVSPAPTYTVAAHEPTYRVATPHIEKSVKESKRYAVLVRFEDGSSRTFSSKSVPAWQSGDRVRLQNGLLTMGGGRSNGNPGTI